MKESSSVVGMSAMRQRRAPFFSSQLVRIGDYPWSYMMKFFFVKITLQSASHMGPRPMRVWWKEGMTLPAQGKSGGRLGITKSAAPLYWWFLPLTVPMVILGAVGSKLIVGAFIEK